MKYLADLVSEPSTIVSLLSDLQKVDDITVVGKKYGVFIPHWLTIKYKCVGCSKETRSRIQAKSIKRANREMTCPFCRKVSKMFNIHIKKDDKDLY